MNIQAFQVALAQLAMLIFSTMVVISQPKLAYIIAIILGLTLSYSIGTAAALADELHKSVPEENKQDHTAILGTHLGGAICYIVLLEELMNKIQ